ncbi:MAG TPA: putative phage tail protein, partial [Rhizomicrobium sp.]|nr:putative phage tail protein [Rhizomicrobium sp.]
MSAPYSTLTAADYLDAAQALLPSGPAWPRDTNTTFAKYMSAIANVAWLAHQMLSDLFVNELNPGTATALLPDWEAAFGLPGIGSKPDRRNDLTSVISDPGGFSAGHYIALAAFVGVDLAVPYTTTGVRRSGLFAFEVHALCNTPNALRPVMESIIRLHNRATCTVSFFYDVPPPSP